MIRRMMTALFLLIVTARISSCTAKDLPTDSSTAGTTLATVLTTSPTPTPVPTYAPGTELYGMLSVTGEVVIEPKYEYLDLFSDEGLARFKDHGLWGFVNENGEVVIPAQYEDANNFSEGLAAVKVDGLYGFIDKSGKMMIEPQFEEVTDGFIFDRCVIQKGSKQGIIDQTGMIIVEPQYRSIDLYCENYSIVQFEDKTYGIIDRLGKIMAEGYDAWIYAVTDTGYFFVHQESGADLMYEFDGNMFFVSPIYSWDRAYKIHNDSLIKASPDGVKWGLFDLSKDKYLIEAIYDSIDYQPGNEYAQTYLYDPEYFTGAVNVATGQVILECDNMYVKGEYGYIIYTDEDYNTGVVDSSGQTILHAVYQQICATPQGDFFVIEGNRYYVIDTDGKILKEFMDLYLCDYFESIDVWSFEYTGLEPVEDLHISGFLDGSFNVIVDHEYNNYHLLLGNFTSYPNSRDVSIAPVPVLEDNPLGEYRFINSSGYADGWYSDISCFPDQGVLVVEDIDGKCGLVSYDGAILFALQPCHIFTNPDDNESLNAVNWNTGYQYAAYNDSDRFIYTVKAG